MKKLEIKSIVVKKYQFQKNQGTVPNDKENILNRDFSADTVFKKLVTDITYIHVVNEGWTYLTSVMDLYDRKIIGWAYGKNITAEFATQAVKNACLNISDTTGIVLHSDLGSQYTSEEFEKYLQDQGMLHSFSRKGNPYDNACIESFHFVLKRKKYTQLHITHLRSLNQHSLNIQSHSTTEKGAIMLLITRHHNRLKMRLQQPKK